MIACTLRLQAGILYISETLFDARAPEVKRKATDAASGRKMATVSRVEGAGHLVKASRDLIGWNMLMRNLIRSCKWPPGDLHPLYSLR